MSRRSTRVEAPTGRTARLVYSALHYLAMPLILGRLAWRGRANAGYRRGWSERFGFGRGLAADRRRVWIHAVSVGEAQATLPLVQALQSRYPDLEVLVTTTTPTGGERVRRALGTSVAHRYVPYDLPGSVARFLARARPSLAIIMETEFWPNLFEQCRRRGIPLVLANVRLSERSAAGYRRFPALVAPMLRGVTLAACQSATDAERLIGIGADARRVEVNGSIKFDVRPAASLGEEGQALRRCFGVDRAVWIAASTHEGEEEALLEVYGRLRRTHPGVLLVVVPRHPERFARVVSLARRRGYRVAVRSAAPDSCAEIDVFVGDTMGELPLFYAASDVAFVGGSLVAVGGHNPLEPAALAVPVVMGPHMFNFAEIARRLCEEGAARQVRHAGELDAILGALLGDANLRHAAGERGRRFVADNRGALDRLMRLLAPMLADRRPDADTRVRARPGASP